MYPARPMRTCPPEMTVSSDFVIPSGVPPPIAWGSGSSRTPGASRPSAAAVTARPQMAAASPATMPTLRRLKRATPDSERGTSMGATPPPSSAASTAGRDSHHTPSWRPSSVGSTPS